MAVSNRPWSDFTQADYTPEQWARACLIDTGQGAPDSKNRYKLPVKEPDGTLNRNAVHAAAGGHGIGQVQGISPEGRRAAARKLVALYRQDLGEEPPPSLLAQAGMAARSLTDGAWEWRTTPGKLELRDSPNGGEMFVGYAWRYGELSQNLGGFVERVMPGAGAKTMQEQDLRGLFNHNPDNLLGRMGAGTLRMRDDGVGGRYEIDRPDTSLGRDLAVLIARGDIYGSSFTFKAVGGARGASWSKTDTGFPMRSLLQFKARDVGPVTFPAYSNADVALRSLAEARSLPFEELIAAAADERLAELLDPDPERPRDTHRRIRRYY